jgi:tetratricopeptide (TPR) repeat protein
MKSIIFFCFLFLFVSCSNSVDFTQEHIQETSGRYLYAPDEVLEVYYENNKLYLKWRGAEKIEPVVLDENTFFIPDMYKKLRFVKQSGTNDLFLSVVNPEDEDLVTYDYLKLSDSVDIPSEYLRKGNYDKALTGYLEIQRKDSSHWSIDEYEFNRLGYSLLSEKEYQNAINVFKINVALYPKSSNVYDSLADAYLRSGDSIEAYNNYKLSLELDVDNVRAKHYIKAYNSDSEE